MARPLKPRLRKNGTTYYVNIPKEFVKALRWEDGHELMIAPNLKGEVVLSSVEDLPVKKGVIPVMLATRYYQKKNVRENVLSSKTSIQKERWKKKQIRTAAEENSKETIEIWKRLWTSNERAYTNAIKKLEEKGKNKSESIIQKQKENVLKGFVKKLQIEAEEWKGYWMEVADVKTKEERRRKKGKN